MRYFSRILLYFWVKLIEFEYNQSAKMDFKRLGIFVLIFTLVAVLLGWNHIFELRFEEPRRAIVTWEMFNQQNPIKPTIHGWAYYNKPPFFNWVVGAFASVFGFSEWVMRFPSILALLFSGVLFYRVGKKYLDKVSALYIGLFTATSSQIFFHSAVFSAEIDLFFLFLTVAQVLSIFVFHEKKQYLLMFTLSYALAAGGVLTKGLPSIAFQGITLLAWLLVNKQWKLLFGWQHILGFLLFVGLLGGYFYLYSLQDDALAFASNLFKEASQRTALENTFLKSLGGFALFPFKLIQLLFPWSLLLIFTIRKSFWAEIKTNKFLFFSAVFILANIPLYWLSPGVKSRYLFMFFPFIFAIISHFFVKYHNEDKKAYRILDKFWMVLIVLIGLAFLVLPFIKLTASVSLVWVRVVFLVGLTGGLFYLYQQHKDRVTRLFLVVMLIIIARLGYNLVFMLGQLEASDSMIYRDLTTEILEITQDEEVRFGDEVLNYKKEIALGPFFSTTYKLKRPPFFHYQIPYYLSKTNGHVMQFDEEIVAKVFYILPKEKAEKLEMKVYKEFYPSKKKDRLWALAKKE